MINHHKVMRNLCDALTASDAVRLFCVGNFAKGCHIQLNAYGAEGLPDETQAPFIFVFSDGENESAGEIGEASFEVTIVAAVCSQTEGGTDIQAISERTKDANGLTVVGIAEKADELLTIALDVVKRGNHGAILRTATISGSGTLDYPLQWSRARLTFYESYTLSDDD